MTARSDAVFEVFRIFLKLGLTSFGGPIAHLGYFRNELVVKRQWLDEKAYADLIALCQFLPGPLSAPAPQAKSVSAIAEGSVKPAQAARPPR